MENRSHALLTGFFTIALIVAAILAGVWFNRDRTEHVPYMIATTQSMPGLSPQASVRYRGLEVGKVADIDFDQRNRGQIDVTLSIAPDAPITTTTYATLGYQGVTGIAYVQLDDDKTGSPALKSSKERIAVIPIRPGFLDQLEKRGKVILDNAEALTQRANELLSPAHQQAMMAAVDHFSKAADAYGKIPQQLQPTLDRLPALTAKTEKTIAAFNDTADKVGRLSADWDALANRLGAPDGPVDRLSGTMNRINGVAANVELQTLPHVLAMTDEARTSLRAVKRTVNTIGERPQSLIFGGPVIPPGPGEPGFTPPSK